MSAAASSRRGDCGLLREVALLLKRLLLGAELLGLVLGALKLGHVLKLLGLGLLARSLVLDLLANLALNLCALACEAPSG